MKVRISIPNAVYSRLLLLALANSPEHQVLMDCLLQDIQDIDDDPNVTTLFCNQADAQKLIDWVRNVLPEAASHVRIERRLDS